MHAQNQGYAFFNGRMNNGGNNAGPGGTQTGFRGYANAGSSSMLPSQEFCTPDCNDLNVYHFGSQIGHGAYAIVKECIHKPSGEKVAIKQYDRSKL